MSALLHIRDLEVAFDTPRGSLKAVDGVSLEIGEGEIFGLVGESGCGKSATCRSIIRLFAGAPARVAAGHIRFDDREIQGLSDRELQRLRGGEIGMIFQDPMSALNPTMTVERQIGEALADRRGLSRAERRREVLALLRLVQIPSPEERLKAYPHELSGGLRQRIVIAIALAGQPRLLLADEPTTALDVTVQDQILKLLLKARDLRGAAILLVTHDLGVVAQTCDRMAVMYAGMIVETGKVTDVLAQPRHPYTQALLRALPARADSGRLVSIEGAPPDLLHPPEGCRFSPRCRFAIDDCIRGEPPLRARARETPAWQDACIRGEQA